MKSKLFKKLPAIVVILFIFQNVSAQWSWAYTPNFRFANSVFIRDYNNSVLVGGNKTNDQLCLALYTTDTAQSWNIGAIGYIVNGSSGFGPWLKSVAGVSHSSLITVGDNGSMWKSLDNGISWDTLVTPTGLASRQFNSVFFVDSLIGYVVGAFHNANSLAQTILKTVDGGITWTTQHDSSDYGLNGIYFSNALHGIAVGDSGTILRTTDGGANWNRIMLTDSSIATRTFKGVYLVDNNTGFIVGGQQNSTQTILKTTDGGLTWNAVKDESGHMLNAIDFSSASKVYAVGDSGAVLHSVDAGNTWTLVDLDSISQSLDLYDVDFLNDSFGLIVGRAISIRYFISPPPLPPLSTVATLPATSVNATGAQMNGSVNANGSYAVVKFQYGTGQNLGTYVVANMDTIFDSVMLSVHANLSGLMPNTFYYYRIEAVNEGGQVIGETNQFYTADCVIPNCDFENWIEVQQDYPAGWSHAGNTQKVISYNRSTAIRMTGALEIHDNGGVILNGDFNDPSFTGGIKLNGAVPDSFIFYAKYDIIPADTAFGVVVFKKNGEISYIHPSPMVGSSGDEFVRISRPINYPSSDLPDSMMIVLASSNAFSDNLHPESVVTVDDVSFSGTTNIIPNGDFEDVIETTAIIVRDWSVPSDANMITPLVRQQRTTDRISGNYAMRIMNLPNDTFVSQLFLGSNNDIWNHPSFRVAGRHTTLNFYAKFFPQNNDSLLVKLNMYKQGVSVGQIYAIIDTAINDWQAFTLNINYQNQTDIPDSAQLIFSLGNFNAHGESVAYFDNLSFDGFRTIDSTTSGIKEPENSLLDLFFKIYPNPAQSVLNVEYFNNATMETAIVVTDLQGRVVSRIPQKNAQGMVKSQIDIAGLSEGTYVMSIYNGFVTMKRKFAVIR